MSTPVSVEPPPLSRLRSDSEQERELRAKMQHMIDLQYQQQALPSYHQRTPVFSTTSASAATTTTGKSAATRPAGRHDAQITTDSSSSNNNNDYNDTGSNASNGNRTRSIFGSLASGRDGKRFHDGSTSTTMPLRTNTGISTTTTFSGSATTASTTTSSNANANVNANTNADADAPTNAVPASSASHTSEAEKRFFSMARTPTPSFRVRDPQDENDARSGGGSNDAYDPGFNAAPISPMIGPGMGGTSIDSYVGSGVGKGTLYIPQEYRAHMVRGRPNVVDSANVSLGSMRNSPLPQRTVHRPSTINYQQPLNDVADRSRAGSIGSKTNDSMVPGQIGIPPQSLYGAIVHKLDTKTTTLGQQQHLQQQQQGLDGAGPDQFYQDETGVIVQDVPIMDGLDGLDADADGHEFMHPQSRQAWDDRDEQPRRSFAHRCCSCVFDPVVYYLSLEHLQRSFCFGAIDGMLTGSGIIGACSGLGILGISTRYETRLAILALTISACIADAVCMAFGHVWESYVVSSNHATERQGARHELDMQKPIAKAKLVDMLLARGVLKIDAMSLADTLEGYPDLFVDTMVGDSLLGSPQLESTGSEADSSSRQDPSFVMENTPLLVGGAGGVPQPPVDQRNDNIRNGIFNFSYPSYGHFDVAEHDPETENVNMVVTESQREGLFMMVGFSMFAVVPSLLWLFFPIWVGTDPSLPASQRAASGSSDAVSLASLIVTLSATTIGFLGAWKAKFLDPDNWLLFGIQTIIVLLICVASSFGVGKLCAKLLPDAADVESLFG